MAVSAGIGVVVAAGAAAAAGPWQGGQRTAERRFAAARDGRDAPAGPTRKSTSAAGTGRRPAAKPAPAPADIPDDVPTAAPVLLPADGTSVPLPAGLAATLAGKLKPLLTADGMGPVRTGAVVDVSSGTVLYDHQDGTATTPASTTKLATATAALGVLGPDKRLTTRVVAAGGNQVVLVGGGDPTLELGQLAKDTAKALKAAGRTKVSLGYDTSLYSGPTLHPIGHNDNLAPVTALMDDEGRLDGSSSGPAPRAWDPAADAAGDFAQLLGAQGITVTGPPQQRNGTHGAVTGSTLATHSSAPLDDLVERMLTNSDNDLAEALIRQVALASGQPASFSGGAKATRAALVRYGVPLPQASFHDGSGLDHDDRLAPLTLARLLALAAGPAHPELRSVLSGIPVADFTGTLATRFQGSPGAGVVHAKTGTLTGTNTIAGTVVTPEGRLLAFSFMTQGAYDPAATEGALDDLAAAVAVA
ncbi:D-alanyl-D-alanine carboxypeptidase / D-alanyl-D-alanine-endopeptidase (penicillin-binding protein 4) [Actinacidiphila yanglinensis]|uniref:D-alanyl-D-alanine carboxypeptidase / D-alanyl-D-alanine-endopeptidase (Penicillin-binding protein 4) n=1 Tax=Actinacidiphila yanglinensis TaxID=310779 RepID=A0A1H5Z1H5_9ACTN|nr:D-alanyl-D-alanine carboxypeptidase/D-alanyl-D-alanine-endopeptidase [Actinacidiphila yanglinensis]SEG30449.1 D-alanyl-D-alanine carboxypeptidase / D-alanyl-D-alanine-endopeptidase (penicillin-binding protein 4) [Actinacidiphila yanglinensis]